MWRSAVRMGCALVVALGVLIAPAQASAQTLAQSSDDALRAMEQIAGVIFAGRVLAVRRQVGNDGAAGVVEIEFAVDDAVRGVSGASYTLREWAGLWPAGDGPFCVGQRFLMLLYAPNAAGLSSPVGGMDGAIPIRGGGAAATDGGVVDLRWVQTAVVHPLVYRAESVARPIGMRSGLRANVVPARSENLGEPQMGPGSVAAESAADTMPSAEPAGEPYATALGKLRGWVRFDHAKR
jgi:hypothetical protein